MLIICRHWGWPGRWHVGLGRRAAQRVIGLLLDALLDAKRERRDGVQRMISGASRMSTLR